MVKVKIALIGGIAQELSRKRIIGWKSSFFSICEIIKFNLNAKPDLVYNRGFSDYNLCQNLPTIEQIKSNSDNKDPWDITIYVMSAPLEYNFYSRILDENRIVVTYYEIKKILKECEIPLEYYLIRLLYSYSLLHTVKKEKFLSMQDEEYLSHEDNRGCIFDMCGTYQEISSSVNTPTICDECAGKLVIHNFPNDKILQIRKELKGLKLAWINRLRSKIKQSPLLSLIFTILLTLIITLIGNFIFDWLK